MSHIKHALELAVETHAPRLGVDPDALNDYVMSGKARTFVEHGYAPVPPAVHNAARAFGIYPPDLLAWWLTARATPPELVSEDDYRGVAADLIARWADDHVDAATALASLNLAAHGMPVTTPSRRALAKVRDLAAILDEVGA